MECPRCGGSLTAFTLAGSTATVCESCEYVGVPADHRPDPNEASESWEEALERFHSGGGEDSGAEDGGEEDEVDEAGDGDDADDATDDADAGDGSAETEES